MDLTHDVVFQESMIRSEEQEGKYRAVIIMIDWNYIKSKHRSGEDEGQWKVIGSIQFEVFLTSGINVSKMDVFQVHT